jgi:uncharacterized protein YjdB
MNQKLIGYIVIGVVAAALVAGVVAAAYWMQSQNTPDIVVNPTTSPASLTITPDKTSLTVGEILTLTSTVSDGTSGLTIIFYNQQNNPVGTATTDASGTATIQIIPPVGTWQYYTKAEHT